MKQSVPRSVKGVEPDARETAKELARRSGMSLGQWLNAMIAEQTSPEAAESSTNDPSPLEALAGKLESMNRRDSATAAARLPAEATSPSIDRLRESETRIAGILESLLRRNADAETLAAGLIENVARASRDTEAKTANALAAVAKWIELSNRAPKPAVSSKATERQMAEAMLSINARLDKIETKLPAEDVTKPLKAALEGLETRLAGLSEKTGATKPVPDEVTKTAVELERRLAEMAARLDTAQSAHKAAEERANHVATIETKLGNILESLSARQGLRHSAPSVAPPPSHPPAPLDAAIEQISARQRFLDEPSGSLEPPVWPPRPRGGAAPQTGPARPDPAAPHPLESQIAGLTREIAALREARRETRLDLSTDPAMIGIKADVAALARGVAALAPSRHSETIEARLDDLAARIDTLRHSGVGEDAVRSIERHIAEIARAAAKTPTLDLSALTVDLKEISAKLDEVAAQHLDLSTLAKSAPPPDAALRELRGDVEALARGLAALTPSHHMETIEARLDDLAARFDTLRHSGVGEDAVRSIERHIAEIARAAGKATPPDLSALTVDLKEISAKLDELAVQRLDLATLAKHAPLPDSALRELRGDVAALSRALACLPAKATEALEKRIDGLAERIEALRGAGASERAIQQVEKHLADIVRSLSNLSPREADEAAIGLRAVAAKLDVVTAQSIDAAAILRLQDQVGEIHAMLARMAKPGDLDALAERLDGLSDRLELIQSTLERPTPVQPTAPLEAMVRQLVERLERAQRPEADDRALEALERQITRIADRLEVAPANAPDLSAIENTLADLIDQLERTREAAVEAADDAASRAVRETLVQYSPAGLADPVADEMKRHLADLHSSQDQAGRRTQLTLEAVHATLEGLSDRMGQFEAEFEASVRRPPASAGQGKGHPPDPALAISPNPAGLSLSHLTASAGSAIPAHAVAGAGATKAARPEVDSRHPPSTPAGAAPVSAAASHRLPATKAAEMDLGGDIPLEPGQSGLVGRAGRPPIDPSPARAMSAAAGSDSRASFIAAARRAAQAAANELATLPAGEAAPIVRPEPRLDSPPPKRSRGRPNPGAAAGAATSPLTSRLKGLYQRRKRPILLGLAASIVALGTIQVARLAFPNNDEIGMGVPPAPPVQSPSAGPPAAGPSTPVEPSKSVAKPAQPAGETATKPVRPQAFLLAPATVATTIEPPSTEPRIGVNAAAPVPDGVPSLSEGMIAATDAGGSDATAGLAPAETDLDEAVKAGDPRALYEAAGRLADSHNGQRDLAGAAELYRRAAEKGFAPAQYRLASMHEKGVGVARDVNLARTWYAKAAEQGNIKAMHNMAVLHAEGAFDGKPDYGAAAQWFRQAAEHGLRDSEYNYAILIARGLGSERDLEAAYKWFALAAAQGDEDASAKRDEVGRRLDADALERSKAAVAAFKPLAAPEMANDATLPAVSWAGENKKRA
jgi:localization factor PodJL